jgi:hypothetical protein
MRSVLVLPPVLLLAGVLVALPDSDPAPTLSAARQAEVAALQAHFDVVRAELLAAPTDHLTPAQRLARLELVDWLGDYRESRAFPTNDLLPGVAIPIFRDSRGAFCAMAYLIERSGRGDIVDRVARTRNTAYVAELADEPALIAWLDSVGMTVAEAGRVQPTYGPYDPERRVSANYALTSVAVTGASLASATLNLASPSRWTGAAGVLAGAAAIVAGAAEAGAANDSDDENALIAVNLIAGTGAALLGAWRLIRPPAARIRAPAPGEGPAVAVEPAVLATQGRPRAGLLVRVSF